MKGQMTVIAKRESDGEVALCPAPDIASQGGTVAEARENPAETLTLFSENASAEEIEGRLRSEVQVNRGRRRLGCAFCRVDRYAGFSRFMVLWKCGATIAMWQCRSPGRPARPPLQTLHLRS